MKYYSLKNILEKNCKYNMIIGERSNGKSYAVLKYALEQYWKNGSELAYIRRWNDDLTGRKAQDAFSALVYNNEIVNITNGAWDYVRQYSGKLYFEKSNEKGEIVRSEKPFGHLFGLSTPETYKSLSYPGVRTILFEEFLTQETCFRDEWSRFQSVLSTIIRDRNDVTIFMLGNTVNKYSPYFGNMGLTHIKQMKQGTIDVYSYGQHKNIVAVEYCNPTKHGKKSDVYFCFDDSSSMITSGEWDFGRFPLMHYEYKKEDIIYSFFILFDEEMIQCDIIRRSNAMPCLFFHKKTTPIKNNSDLVFGEYSERGFCISNIRHIPKICTAFTMYDKFYSDNEVGQIIKNYTNSIA